MKYFTKPLLLFYIFNLMFAQTSSQPNGSGTENDPYLISGINQLYWISQNSDSWDKYFLQTSDINAGSSKNWNSGKGFTPIGNDNVKFTGHYDGSGYIIDSLFINRPVGCCDDYKEYQKVGFFGYASQAEIFDLGITNADIIGHQYVGILIGYARTKNKIKRCFTSGIVKGNYNTGGLIGVLDYEDRLNESYSEAEVYGNRTIGGLVGYASTRSNIWSTYFKGNVNRLDYENQKTKNFGGIAGRVINNSFIYNSYSIGQISGDEDVGGISSETIRSSKVNNSFWDFEISKVDSSDGGEKKTTQEMKY